MIHLKIQQKNVSEGGLIENVSGAVISALYNISKDENLVYDPDDLKGDLQVSGTYQKYANELHTQYPNLNITALSWYIYFDNSEIEQYWATSEYGDGTGITITSAQSVVTCPPRRSVIDPQTGGRFAFFYDNTITSFNELGQFTNLTTLPSCMFKYSSLQSIDLSNIKTLMPGVFRSSALRGVINAPKLNFLNPTRDFNIVYNGSSQNLALGAFADTAITEIHIGQDVIPGLKISEIPYDTFRDCTQLSVVTGLEEVVTLGKDCFRACSNIVSLPDLNDNITSVQGSAFQSDTSLLCINITNCTTINADAFSGCNNLLALDTNDVSEGNTNSEYTLLVVTLGNSAFKGTKLTNKTVSLPNITTVPVTLFQNSGVKKVVAANATSILGSAFSGCSSLTEIDLGDVTSIGNDTFWGCTSLQTIKFGNKTNDFTGLTTIGKNCFNKNQTPLVPIPSDLNMPNLTGTLENNSFYGRTEITSISNLGSVDTINGSVFCECSNLSSITFPSTLRTIRCSAFDSTAITQLIIPEGVTFAEFGQTKFPSGQFKYLEFPSTVTNGGRIFHRSLESDSENSVIFVIKATTPPTISIYGNELNHTKNGAKKFSGIYVPDAALTAYQSAGDVWAYQEIQDRLKPISQLQTDSPTYWQVYQSGLSS